MILTIEQLTNPTKTFYTERPDFSTWQTWAKDLLDIEGA